MTQTSTLRQQMFNRIAQGLRARLLAPLRPKDPTLRTVKFHGLRVALWANEAVGWEIISRGTFESKEFSLLGSVLTPNDICLDIGANFGLFSVFMASRAQKVVAIEPFPLNVNLVELNGYLNKLGNIEIIRCAVGRSAGESEYLITTDSAFNSLRYCGPRRVESKVSVTIQTLDVISKDLPRVDILKMDIEGGEFDALAGAESLLCDTNKRPRLALIEMNSKALSAFGATTEDVLTFMTACGYEVTTLTPQGLLKGWHEGMGTGNAIFLLPELTQELLE
jgi:FkbM family methyltransferase